MGEAFCKLLFAKNGGRFTKTGMPIFEKEAKGTCQRGFDCHECGLIHEWVQSLEKNGYAASWECDSCLRKPDEKGVERFVTEYYHGGQSGLAPDDPEFDPDIGGLPGCMSCGFRTSFLQLILRCKRE